ncbi:BolA family protein [Neisseria chenwenguii]|uniref:BolA family transcriptional regulator n=1 Tax=Neisseria chenwenguii TaxID=1853278 RepID=A0A220S2K2_9NEIS|nr:BolA family protein [Neisseria chenwenguii]ASK27598.1 BolA family transcriptional regulator [Neisseria chenwenguii]ROV55515.1 BolA family transcriptional regulator [Neisseria chenwenguii]
MDMRQTIEGRLKTLSPQVFEFRDDSHLHVGHAGNKGGGHYAVLVVSNSFAGVGRVERQRMVKNLLQDLFSDGLIHALSIKALTHGEYFK